MRFGVVRHQNPMASGARIHESVVTSLGKKSLKGGPFERRTGMGGSPEHPLV
jgi:hypothetical protein